MEAARSLDRTPHFSALGGGILRKEAYRKPLTIASHLRCSNGYCRPASAFLSSSVNNFSSSSSSSRHSSFTGFGKNLCCPLDLGSVDDHTPDPTAALNVSSDCLARAAGGSATWIYTSSGSRNVSWVGCKWVIAGARGATANCSYSLTGSTFFNGQWRTFGNFDGGNSGNTAPLCSRAILAMMTLRFPAEFGSKGQTCKMTCLGHGFGAVDRRAAEQRPQLFYMILLGGKGKRRPLGVLRQLCEATGQSGTGQPVPEEENPEAAPEQVPPPVPGQNSELPLITPLNSEPAEVDWRAFRARLVVTELTPANNEIGTLTDEENTGSTPVGALGTRWAHPILAPEAGCVLIATDKIDGQQGFERSVILLLSPGSSKPREGPYGLILNRPLSCRIKDIKPKDRTIVKFFGNCQVHHGGPLDEDMFLLLHGTQGVKGYREVIPGVYYGAASGLEEIMKGKRPLDYRFFFGYSGWSVEQLKKEIDAGLWCVAACSTNLIIGHSAAGLWEEILLLMGGKYAELSKRPRRRHF